MVPRSESGSPKGNFYRCILNSLIVAGESRKYIKKNTRKIRSNSIWMSILITGTIANKNQEWRVHLEGIQMIANNNKPNANTASAHQKSIDFQKN